MNNCKKCGKNDNVMEQENGPHMEQRCMRCNKWVCWVRQNKLPFGSYRGKHIDEIPDHIARYWFNNYDLMMKYPHLKEPLGRKIKN